MNMLLIVVLLVIIVMGAWGFYRGMLKIAFSMISLILSILIVSLISPSITSFLEEQTPLYSATQENVKAVLLKGAQEKGYDAIENSTQALEVLNSLPFPQAWKEAMIKNVGDKLEEALGIDGFLTYTSEYLTDLILKAVAFVLTLILVFALIRMFGVVLNIVDKLPVIHGLSHIGGLIIGLLEGWLIVSVFFLAITMFSGSSFGISMYKMIQESKILTALYNHNIMDTLVLSLTRLF